MKVYAWSIDYESRRGDYVRTENGIVLADDYETASNAVWAKYGSDFAYNMNVCAMDMDALNSGEAVTI